MIRLKELRLEKGYKSQKDFAEALNISKSTYNYWENEKIEIDYTSLDKLASHFNVSIDYLLGRTDIRNNSGYTVPENMNDVQIAFAGGLDGLTQEDLDDVSEYIKFIKARKNNI